MPFAPDIEDPLGCTGGGMAATKTFNPREYSDMGCYVVTGGAGFIGSHIVRHLVKTGANVRVVDDLSTGHRENLAPVLDEITFLEGSVCDPALLKKACDGAEVIFHEAALASVPRSIEDPLATNRANVEGTLRVLQTAHETGVRRVVTASSSSVYGDSPELPKEESMPLMPKSPYATSKAAGELYCRNYADLFDVETVGLRYFNVFGPRQDPESQYAAVIPIFITAVLSGDRPTVFGDGEQSRDFTFVENVVEANLCAARAPEASGEVFNVGCGERYTLNELLDALANISESDVCPEYADERPGDVRHSEASIDKAREILGYTPGVTFREGLQRTFQWYQDRSQTVSDR